MNVKPSLDMAIAPEALAFDIHKHSTDHRATPFWIIFWTTDR